MPRAVKMLRTLCVRSISCARSDARSTSKGRSDHVCSTWGYDCSWTSSTTTKITGLAYADIVHSLRSARTLEWVRYASDE